MKTGVNYTQNLPSPVIGAAICPLGGRSYAALCVSMQQKEHSREEISQVCSLFFQHQLVSASRVCRIVNQYSSGVGLQW